MPGCPAAREGGIVGGSAFRSGTARLTGASGWAPPAVATVLLATSTLATATLATTTSDFGGNGSGNASGGGPGASVSFVGRTSRSVGRSERVTDAASPAFKATLGVLSDDLFVDAARRGCDCDGEQVSGSLVCDTANFGDCPFGTAGGSAVSYRQQQHY